MNRIDRLDKNLFINGLYKPYAQRLPSGIANLTTSFTYQVLDRFMGRYAGIFGATPTWGVNGNYSEMIGDFSDGTGRLELQQRIESILSWEMINNPISLGFEVYSESCNQIVVEFYYPDAEDDWTGETLIDSKTFNISLNTLTELKWEGFTGHINSDRGIQARFIFQNPQVTGSNTVHRVSKTKLNIGLKAQQWSPCGRNLIDELKYCQRYFEKTSSNMSFLTVIASTNVYNMERSFNTTKRTNSPVITYYDYSTGNPNVLRDTGDLTYGVSIQYRVDEHQTGYPLLSSTINASRQILFTYSADDEI